VFDIDGVLLRGNVAIPGAAATLRKLDSAKTPYIFLTNGGGVLEADKAAKVSKVLQFDIDPARVVLAHSPMKSLVKQYQDKLVLVFGRKGASSLAQE